MNSQRDLRKQLRQLIGVASDLNGVLCEAQDLDPVVRISAEHELIHLLARLENLADGIADIATPHINQASRRKRKRPGKISFN